MSEIDKFEFMRKLAKSKNGLEQDNTNNNEDVTKSENLNEESKFAQEENEHTENLDHSDNDTITNSNDNVDKTENISQQQKKVEENKTEIIICPNCQKECTSNDIFCSKCGCKIKNKQDTTNTRNQDNTDIENKKERVCKYCNAKYEDGDDFCGECGRRIDKLYKPTNTKIIQKNVEEEYKSNIHSDNKISQSICPYCKQSVPIGATKCSHCGEWLKRDSRVGCFGILNIIALIFSIVSGICYSIFVPVAAPFIILIIIGLYILFLIYFIPTWVAENRNHPSSTAIFILNLLLGETVIFWVIALIWALSGGNRK